MSHLGLFQYKSNQGDDFMRHEFLTVLTVFLTWLYAPADWASAQTRPQIRPNTNQSRNFNGPRDLYTEPAPLPVADSTGKNYAVLIGINTYSPAAEKSANQLRTRFRDLNYCIDDMTALKAALSKSKYTEDKNIILLVAKEDTTLESIRNALMNFKISGNDNILVAFSGHGISLAPISDPEKKDDYFCCSDAQVVYDRDYDEFRNQGLLSLTEMNDILKSYNCKSTIFITDCCRNILTEERFRQSEEERKSGENSVIDAANSILSDSMIRGFPGDASEQQNNIQGFFRIASCSKAEVSHEPTDLGHGVFNYFLIKGLEGAADENGDGNITLIELFDYARTQTMDYVRTNIIYTTQTPRISMEVKEGTGFVLAYCDPKTPAPPVQPEVSSTPQSSPNTSQSASGTRSQPPSTQRQSNRVMGPPK